MIIETVEKLEKVLGNGKATALSRALLILFSLVGIYTGGALVYYLPSAVAAFFEMRDASRDNRAFIAEIERRRVIRDAENNKQDAALARHDQEFISVNGRLVCLELTGKRCP